MLELLPFRGILGPSVGTLGVTIQGSNLPTIVAYVRTLTLRGTLGPSLGTLGVTIQGSNLPFFSQENNSQYKFFPHN